MPDIKLLKDLQALPLDMKVALTKQRIREWVREYGVDGVFISFSGGKDSTVLLHIARQIFPKIRAVFVDTGLEYPEIRKFVKTFDNIEILRPKMRFDEVIKKYGYPIISKEVSECVYGARRFLEEQLGGVKNTDIDTKSYLAKQSLAKMTRGQTTSIANYVDLESMPIRTARVLGLLTRENKIMENIPESDRSNFNCTKYAPLLDVDFKISHYCCNVMKKSPVHIYERKTGRKSITAQMASESRLRTQQWLLNGCNGFDMKNPKSNPMAFWLNNDILQYILENKLEICEVYGDIEYVYPEQIGFFEEEETFDLATMGCDRTGCIFCGFGCHLEKESRWLRLKETHPKQYEYCIGGGEYNENGIWQPNKQGLGLGHCFDVLNEIYGKDFIVYK